ncbi:hypothetical protein A3A71_02830 [Candidatus Berkelbacteria bacterium RIFCSPLOWO2_01_FULL_50_28]|uniref:Uncharacterized protein n=1 Tax=Candidatus Berkelbacteria bacterium RIFCSPLOWO2_01_FULL_50_28 TaxID=1797471 RepID=A0A1F5EC25_9BACT|nr:MAG: hypothetical protein A2807_02365 [Candidatus Berkelbacteria bacterium RIFCSPHIGHO2_01_FULL_50_36]OGD62649.1 MAG: hypothetical protein A3F39_00380 [Candidatus Berkelbacteria bacterium RIFCSPHIGHO2_12_FULL_50_11]OGD64957.1 MAG: hypothetical protein A3A71_02830 [Candidatus Berkelbacteria bacterium RIFCSPLOWO2_01_FULL_50_28]
MSISNPAPSATKYLSVDGNVANLIRERGYVISGGHFDIGGGFHSESWVYKDPMLADPQVLKELCRPMAFKLRSMEFEHEMERIDAFAGRANGGLVIASQLSVHARTRTECYFAEETHLGLKFRPSFSEALKGKRVVVAGVVITTGRTIREVADEVRRQGGEVVGAVAWFRRTLTGPGDLGNVPFVLTLNRDCLQTWAEQTCPLCEQGTPLSNEHGIHLPDRFC